MAGFISAMASSLKNNARKRKVLFEKKDGFGKKSKKVAFESENKATKEELSALNSRIIKEKKARIKLAIVIAATSLVILLLFLNWLMTI